MVKDSLAARGISSAKFLVTPTPLNTLLWRVVVMRPGGYEEGFYSLLDADRRVRFEAFPSSSELAGKLASHPNLQRMAAFTHGFFSLQERSGKAVLTDLRMDQEPNYVFSFALAGKTLGATGTDNTWQATTPVAVGSRSDAGQLLSWLGPRMLGKPLPPPR